MVSNCCGNIVKHIRDVGCTGDIAESDFTDYFADFADSADFDDFDDFAEFC